MKITLDSIETLDAIVRHGSFASAAKAMRKAQSAVSYGVKQLEDALGVALFDRRGHRAVLTEAGQRVLDEGRMLLARARRMETLATRFHEDWEPRVEAVIDGILPMEPIKRALRRMADEGVPTQIQIKVEFLGGVQDRFEKDRADLMLVKDYAKSHALREHPLPEVEVVLTAAQDHPLVQGEGRVTLADLQRHVELTVHDSSESLRLADTRLFGGPRVFFLSDFSTKKEAIAMGLGFGWMPMYLVREELARGSLVEVPYDGGSRYAFSPMVVHPRERPLGRAGALLLSLLGAGDGDERTVPPIRREKLQGGAQMKRGGRRRRVPI
jgi:DNA-binding transcriptional LysR family regulator